MASEGSREPQAYGDLFRVLESEGIRSTTVADLMVEMAGFRNVLAHEYASTDERVYAHLQALDRFRAYAHEIDAFLTET